jgi:hypothetical protein
MNHFFEKSTRQQNTFQIKLGLLALFIILMGFYLGYILKFTVLGFIFVYLTLISVAPFFDVPGLVKKGRLFYLSSSLLAEKVSESKLKLHSATLFDIYFNPKLKATKYNKKAFIIKDQITGILNLIELYENGKINNVNLSFTTYFLNETTAQKMGFKQTKLNLSEKLLLFANFFNVFLFYCLAVGKVKMPKLSATKTYTSSLKQLKSKKESLILLQAKLEGKL